MVGGAAVLSGRYRTLVSLFRDQHIDITTTGGTVFRSRAVSVAVVVLVIGLAACGNSGDDEAAPTTTADDGGAAATEAGGEEQRDEFVSHLRGAGRVGRRDLLRRHRHEDRQPARHLHPRLLRPGHRGLLRVPQLRGRHLRPRPRAPGAAGRRAGSEPGPLARRDLRQRVLRRLPGHVARHRVGRPRQRRGAHLHLGHPRHGGRQPPAHLPEPGRTPLRPVHRSRRPVRGADLGGTTRRRHRLRRDRELEGVRPDRRPTRSSATRTTPASTWPTSTTTSPSDCPTASGPR